MINFKTLQIWERSHNIVLKVYALTNSFPNTENFGLTSQIRRAAVSVPSNIAEGCGRNSDGELSRFVTIAMGSSAELEYQNILSKDLGYISENDFNQLNKEIVEVRKMMNSFLDKVNKRKRARKNLLLSLSFLIILSTFLYIYQ